MKKPKYIKRREKNGEILSTVFLEVDNEKISDFISARDFILVWSNSRTDSIREDIIWIDRIFKTKQGFYIYLNDISNIVIIYYKQEQFNELRVFLRQFLKLFKTHITS